MVNRVEQLKIGVVSQSSRSAVVTVAGDIDLATAPSLRRFLSQHVAEGCTDVQKGYFLCSSKGGKFDLDH
jgi:hypothetical protein